MADERCSPVELVHRALQELGEVTDETLAAFLKERFGVKIDARFLPVLRASVREREVIEKARQAARELVQRLQAEQQEKPAKKPKGRKAKQGDPEEMTPPEIRSFADGGGDQHTA